MPPKKSQKSSKVKREEEERRKRILSKQEKLLSVKHMLLSIVEAMIEKDISKEWFLDNCTKLCHADYEDVIQERNIEYLCGYPLCSSTIKKISKQQYHISVTSNKVYDLTERKCFCSNECYKASKYLKTQLSPIPLYMRKEEKIKVYLLSDCDNRGSAGEEIVFHQKIPQEEIEKVLDEEQSSTNLYEMLNEEVKKCADSLGNLQIKEHVFEKEFVFGDETPKKSDTMHEDEKESDSDDDFDSDDSIEENLFPSHENMEVLSDRHMPIPKKIQKSVLISSLKAETSVSSPVKQLSLDFVSKVFKDWVTLDTMKYLLGEKHVYGLKADSLFEKMTSNDPVTPEKLSSIKNEYIKLCMKIDSLPDDDDEEEEDDLYDCVDFAMVSESKSSPVSKKISNEDSTEKTVFKRKPKGKSKAKTKHVTFAPEVKTSDLKTEQLREDVKNVPLTEDITSEESPTDSSLIEPTLPLVDSAAQNVLRKQVLTGHLKSVYSELLPVIGLHYTDVREQVRKFVETLSLTPTNIIFKPKEWKLISLVLYRILTKTVSKHLQNELQFLKMCEDPFIPISVDVLHLEKIVSELLLPESIINLK